MDDLFVMGAWASSIAVVAGVKLQFSSGIGWHAADIQTLSNGSDILTKMVLVSLLGIVLRGNDDTDEPFNVSGHGCVRFYTSSSLAVLKPA